MRVIGEAAIRLRASGDGLQNSFRSEIKKAISGAFDGTTFADADKEADKSTKSIASKWTKVFAGLKATMGGVAGAIGGAMKLALIGAAAGAALAGITSLSVGLISLVGVLGQASGVIGLLPAVLLAVGAVSTTVKLGLSGMGDAFKALGSGDAAKFRESLKGLAPEAAAFAVAAQRLKPAFDQMKLQVQGELFAHLGSQLSALGKIYLPLASKLFRGLAADLNQGALDAANFAREAGTIRQVSGIGDQIKASFANLIPAVRPLLEAFLNIASVGSTFLSPMTDGIAKLAIKFSDFIKASADSGALKNFFQTAIDVVKQLGTVLKNIGGIFGAIFQAGEAAGGGFLNTLTQITGSVRDFLKSTQGQDAMISFFRSMKEVVAAVMPIFTALAGVIGKQLAPIFSMLAQTLGPAIVTIIGAFGQALEAAKPGIQAFAEGFAKLITAIAPLMPQIGELVGLLAGALGGILQALIPVITEVAKAIIDGLLKILPTLIPIIINVVKIFGDLFIKLTPLIPIFFKLLEAVLPVLEPLARLTGIVLPPLVEILTFLTPLIDLVAWAFRALADVIQVVVDAFNFLIRIWEKMVSFSKDVLGQAFPAIGRIFNGTAEGMKKDSVDLWGTVQATATTGWQGMGNALRNPAPQDAVGNAFGIMQNTTQTGVNNMGAIASTIPSRFAGPMNEMGGLFRNSGLNAMIGLESGLNSRAPAAVGTAQSIASRISSAFAGVLKIFSPSRVFRDHGKNIGAGLILGLQDSEGPVERAARALADTVSSQMTALDAATLLGSSVVATRRILADAGTGTAGGAAALSTIINQTNVMRPGTDVRQFSSTVLGRGLEDVLSGASTLSVVRNGVQAGVNDQWIGAT